LPEKMTFSLPPSDASFMKVKAELIDESANEIILETEQLKVPLSLVSITIVFFSFVLRAVIRVYVFYGKMALSP